MPTGSIAGQSVERVMTVIWGIYVFYNRLIECGIFVKQPEDSDLPFTMTNGGIIDGNVESFLGCQFWLPR